MNEDDLNRRIVAHLNRGVDELPAAAIFRLQAARNAAMQHARGHTVPAGRGSLMLVGQWFAVRFALPVLILVAGMSGVAYWHLLGTQPFDHAEIEAGLLSDELPITAYLDSGFDSWLEETAQD